MNKRIVNDQIPAAYKALDDVGIAVCGKIDKNYRGQISTFGAAISTGSLLSAISFFSDKGGSSVDRTKLLKAIAKLLYQKDAPLFDLVVQEITNSQPAHRIRTEQILVEKITNATIALKLAMNLYQLVEKGKDNE